MYVVAGLSLSSLLAPVAMAQDTFDVVFLSDTTGSMGGLISSAQTSSNAIQTSFLSRGDVRFGVGEYKDGNADAFGFQYNLTDAGAPILSTDSAAVSGAIGAWGASGGGDFPEDGLLGLREVASTAPWREGSRRMIFWFGDATSLDPGSDGTTMATTLAALNEECVQVIAVDLNRLDDLGQATTITSTVLDCGLQGGLYREVTAEEVETQIDEILLGLFDEVIIDSGGPTDIPVASSARMIGITMSNTISRDVGGRLSRLRSGGPGPLSVTTTPDTVGPGGKEVIPGTTTIGDQLRVWGDIYAFSEEYDAQRSAAVPGGILSPDTDLDIFGGTVGIEYRIDSNWTIGLGLGAADAEADLDGYGDIDVDSVAIMPYVSYYQQGALQGGDFWADLMYAYTDSDYDYEPNVGADSSDSGNSDLIELNLGLNFSSGDLVHGPYAQIRYIDGEVDNNLDFESFATQLGYQVSRPMPYGNGTLIPQIRVAWEHEFEHDEGSIGGVNLGELDEDLFVGGIAINYLLDSGVNFGLDYQARLGDIVESHYVGLNAGFRF